MLETLFCENGQHNWERESKRGKKPKNCKEHTPISTPKSAAELNEAGERKLICQEGNHEFWAPVQRGRPPRFCEEHRPSKPGKIIHATEKDGSGEIFLREVYCHTGDHMFLTKRKRGKPPRNCEKHAVSGAIERKGELDQEKKKKAQKLLQDDIARFSARVEEAEIVNEDAMTKLQAAGGVNMAEEEFKIWLRANSSLLHEVESLRARERKLIEL